MRAADVNSRVSLTSGLPLVPMGVSPMMPGPTSLGTASLSVTTSRFMLSIYIPVCHVCLANVR